MNHKPNRRGFLQTALATSAGAFLGAGLRTQESYGSSFSSANEQPVIGFIGAGIRYHTYHCKQAMAFGPCAGIADVDYVQGGRALQAAIDIHREKGLPLTTRVYEDYRHLIDRKDVDVVVIGSVDHWHTKMVCDALNAGKDVYCEKPLTLTIREGQQIVEALKKTGGVMQVGTQQRTEYGQLFVKAAAMMRDNRVGDVKRVTVCIGGSRASGVLPKKDPPKCLNWEMWLGQAPSLADYRAADEIVDDKGWGAGFPFGRAHRYYRWFYEYSGGKLTDWGAHHVDIAMWALDKLGADIGPVKIDPIESTHPVELKDGYPTRDDMFNCAITFNVKCTFADGVELYVRDVAPDLGFENGIMFEGSKGRFLVNRGKLVGKPVETLQEDPLPADAFAKLYAEPSTPSLGGFGEEGYHMKNFMECIKTRKTPASDVQSHNRMLNVCHAVNVALRLGAP